MFKCNATQCSYKNKSIIKLNFKNKSNTIVVYSNYSRVRAYHCARHSMIVILLIKHIFRSSLFIAGERHSELTTRQTSVYMYADNSLCSNAFCTVHLRHNDQNTFIWIWEILVIGLATGNVARWGIWGACSTVVLEYLVVYFILFYFYLGECSIKMHDHFVTCVFSAIFWKVI